MGFPYRRQSTVDGLLGFGPSIILYDDMDDVLKWTNEGNGAATLAKDQGEVYTGDYSLKATSEVPDQSMGDSAGASRNIIIRPGGSNRLYQLFRVDQANEKFMLEWKIEYISDGKLYTASLTYFTLTHTWSYLDAGGSYVNVSGVTHPLALQKWHFFELNINTRTHEFISFTIDNVKVSMANIKYKTEIDAADEYGKFSFLGTLIVGVNAEIIIYLDSVSILAE